MAAVHGETVKERVETAKQYADLGYTALALGGLAGQASRKRMAVDVVGAVREAVPGVWVHVLGLSSPSYFAAWRQLGVESCDGSSHFKQAFTGGAFFVRSGATLAKWAAARPGEPVTAPACNCRACSVLRDAGVDTRQYGSNETNMGRAAHNLNQLIAAQALAQSDRPPTPSLFEDGDAA
jgi:tRNA-guanine family transglycosylase